MRPEDALDGLAAENMVLLGAEGSEGRQGSSIAWRKQRRPMPGTISLISACPISGVAAEAPAAYGYLLEPQTPKGRFLARIPFAPALRDLDDLTIHTRSRSARGQARLQLGGGVIWPASFWKRFIPFPFRTQRRSVSSNLPPLQDAVPSSRDRQSVWGRLAMATTALLKPHVNDSGGQVTSNLASAVGSNPVQVWSPRGEIRHQLKAGKKAAHRFRFCDR